MPTAGRQGLSVLDGEGVRDAMPGVKIFGTGFSAAGGAVGVGDGGFGVASRIAPAVGHSDGSTRVVVGGAPDTDTTAVGTIIVND